MRFQSIICVLFAVAAVSAKTADDESNGEGQHLLQRRNIGKVFVPALFKSAETAAVKPIGKVAIPSSLGAGAIRGSRAVVQPGKIAIPKAVNGGAGSAPVGKVVIPSTLGAGAIRGSRAVVQPGKIAIPKAFNGDAGSAAAKPVGKVVIPSALKGAGTIPGSRAVAEPGKVAIPQAFNPKQLRRLPNIAPSPHNSFVRTGQIQGLPRNL